jgi:hypothetical protein
MAIDSSEKHAFAFTPFADFSFYTKHLEFSLEMNPESRGAFSQRHRARKGGKQILLNDPAGNCIELSEPYKLM